uniref:Ig-like domain-containing protein n=1 Tax=Cyprinus carpio TaxID=7962 RepID=A0A8C1M592_CYPCA
MFILFCLCLWRLSGVFGVDVVKSESVTEGDLVTLRTDVTEILKYDLIQWRFGDILIAKINMKENKSTFYSTSAAERFRDRLKLDQTGSLIITNTRTTDSGVYKVTSSRTETPLNTFNLTVYANLSVPVIIRHCSSSSPSSSSSQQNCSLLCLAVNVDHVTLSWYKGNSLLSSISESDLSFILFLPLEVEYQDKNSYSCVINNPIRNQTTHLYITQLCQLCPGLGISLFYILIMSAAAAGTLLILAAVGIFCICRETDREVHSGEEITYADLTFYKRIAQKSRVQEEEDDVVYSRVIYHPLLEGQTK